MNRHVRRGALAALCALHPAHAQQAAEKLDRIEITGSRIASSDTESASPIAIINAEDIRLQGFSSLELVLANFPQFYIDQGNRISNSASGTAAVSLRSLGAQRTLVLLNGRRMPAGDPSFLAPDLNQIPPALIQRVEVLTGGASAIYGSDAIAGVVNFILNDRFEGVQGDVSYDFYNHRQKSSVAELVRAAKYDLPGDKHRDGESTSASLTIGGNFAQGRGSAAVSTRYFKSQALLQSERDYSACALSRDSSNTIFCGGSGATFPALIVNRGFFTPDPRIDPRPRGLWIVDSGTGLVRQFAAATDQYNYAPTNYYQRPQERHGLYATAKYEVAADARLYAEFGYHDDHTVAQIAPSGLFAVQAEIHYENPFLTDDWRAHLVFRRPDGRIATGPGTTTTVFVNRRNVEGGGRQDDRRHTSFREVVGVKGTLGGSWDYDVFFQTSQVHFQERYSHDFSNSRGIRAMDVVTDPATGGPACRSALDGSDPNCVPYNVWSSSPVTNAAVSYLEIPGFQTARIAQQVTGGSATANLGDYGIRLPRTRAGIEVAVGAERRTDRLDFEADQAFASGDLAGQGQPVRNVKGSYTVTEIYGEVRVPVMDLVNVSGSYRRSAYDPGETTNTFGAGFNAAPARFARLRGSYQRAVRAPSINELFSPQFGAGYTLGAGGDPCAGESPARSLGDCRRTGLAGGLYGHVFPNTSLFHPATVGGNPQLRPETADTYTLGLVLTPARELSATLDYFDIRIEDTISSIDGAVIFGRCIDTGDPLFCSLITRDPQTGTLWLGQGNVIAINQNIGKTRVSGVDAALNYRLALGGHVIALDAIGTWLRRQSVEVFRGAPSTECAGMVFSQCGNPPLPEWRHRVRMTWKPQADFELAATWRYIGSTTNAPSTKVTGGLASVSYFDVAGSWNPTRRLTVRGGINNVADRDPPIAVGDDTTGRLNGNTFSQVYDVLGRHAFFSATLKF